MPRAWSKGSGSGLREDREAGQAGQRDDDDGPGRPGFQQHRRQDHLQQVEEGEGIGGAARQVELHGQAGDVDQQRQEQLVVGDRAVFVPAQVAGDVEGDQAGQHLEHLHQRQVDVEHQDGAGDRGDLADDGDPAQLDQLQHVLVAGDVFDVGGGVLRMRSGRLAPSDPCFPAIVRLRRRRAVHHQAPATIKARAYQVMAYTRWLLWKLITVRPPSGWSGEPAGFWPAAASTK
jgi:hypothetical protein